MKVLVTGGRNYDDAAVVYAALNALKPSEVIHGGASGADSIAAEWAQESTVPERRFPANWAKHGRAAGPIRNQQMLDEAKPDIVAAFPGGAGTASMMRLARAAGVEVRTFSRAKMTAFDGEVDDKA